MLSIAGVARDRAGYYLSDLGSELPAGVPAQWVGTASARVGLEGAVDGTGFRLLLEGHHPVTARPLGTGRTSRAAWDLTFSAPKSASVLFALGGEEVARTVAADHLGAVDGALAYLEAHAITAVRRSGGERVVVATSGALAARFTHAVNRNGDPHLHSHVVTANVVHGSDGRWSACDGRGVWAHRVAAASVYEAQLRASLGASLGVRWSGAPGHTPEIVGVPPEVLGELSSRAADIRRHRHEAGVRSGHGGRVASLATRPPKSPGRELGELVAEWRARARASAGDRAVDTLVDQSLAPARSGVRLREARLDEYRFAASLSVTPHGGAHRRDVVVAYAAGAADGIPAAWLDSLVDHWVPRGPLGVAEPMHRRRDVVPAPHLLQALGTRPLDPSRHAVWVDAARSVEAYRRRWGVTRADDLLGLERPAAAPPARLADHARVTRDLNMARARLGWRPPADMALHRSP